MHHADCGLLHIQVQKGNKLACGSVADAQAEVQTKSPGAADRKAGSNVDAVHGEIDPPTLITAIHHENLFLLQPVYSQQFLGTQLGACRREFLLILLEASFAGHS